MHVIYTGKLVRLRPFRDADEVASLICNQEIWFNEHWGQWYEPEATVRKDFEETGFLSADKYSMFAIERLDTGELVGCEEYGGMSPARFNTWIGTMILEQHRSKGFGREAKQLAMCYLFENYPLQMIWSDTTSEHTRAQAGLEAVGFQPIGTARRFKKRNDRFFDNPFYQLFREDWEKMPVREYVTRGA